jgi:hypothetical protein
MVLKMGIDDTSASEKAEKNPETLKAIMHQNKLPEIPICKREIINDPKGQRRYKKATSREKLEIEDEVIIGFLTQRRRRRGFITRNPAAKAIAAPLNRLERLMDKNIDRIRGRPKYQRINVLLKLNPDFVKHIDDYAMKRGHENRQAAIKWIVRDFLRSNGYPVA